MNQATVNGLKELLRTVLLAIIPLVIVQLQALHFVSTDVKYILVAGMLALLKGLDELLSQNQQGINQKGITGF